MTRISFGYRAAIRKYLNQFHDGKVQVKFFWKASILISIILTILGTIVLNLLLNG